MFKNFALSFTREVSEYVTKEYEASSVILEYGSGGSTILAASKGKMVISTESSAPWLVEIMGAYKEQKLSGDIIPIHGDIGPTKEWGKPQNDVHWKKWPDYSKKAWNYCKENDINPDLVLIDGRFRVACFIASCINITSPTRILFDDFVKRPEYHVVKKIVEPTEIIDDRLAVFDLDTNMISTKFLLNNLNRFYDPR